MKVSLHGMIGNACQSLDEAGDTFHAFSLRELLKHLEMLRENTELVSEFFDLYVKDGYKP